MKTNLTPTTTGIIRYNTWEKIYENTLAAPATSVTISGLDGNTAQMYMLDCRIIASGAVNDVKLQFNADAGSNYGFQLLQGTDTTIAAVRSATTYALIGYISTTAYLCHSSTIIYAKSGFVRTLLTEIGQSITGTTVTQVRNPANSWNNTTDNITSMVISAETNNLGIGTRISLYRQVTT